MSRHPFVQAAVSRKVRLVPTGDSWWTKSNPAGFTAEATKRFNWRLRGVMLSEPESGLRENAGVTHPAENTRRARGPYKPRVEPISSYIFSDSELAEIQSGAVESADTETE